MLAFVLGVLTVGLVTGHGRARSNLPWEIHMRRHPVVRSGWNHADNFYALSQGGISVRNPASSLTDFPTREGSYWSDTFARAEPSWRRTSTRVDSPWTLYDVGTLSGKPWSRAIIHTGLPLFDTTVGGVTPWSGASTRAKLSLSDANVRSGQPWSEANTRAELPWSEVNRRVTLPWADAKTHIGQSWSENTRVGLTWSEANTRAGLPFSDGNTRAGLTWPEANTRAGELLSDGNTRAGLPLSDGNTRTGLPLSDGNTRTGLPLSDGNTRTGLTWSEANSRAGLPLSDGNTRVGQPLSDGNTRVGQPLSDGNTHTRISWSDANSRTGTTIHSPAGRESGVSGTSVPTTTDVLLENNTEPTIGGPTRGQTVSLNESTSEQPPLFSDQTVLENESGRRLVVQFDRRSRDHRFEWDVQGPLLNTSEDTRGTPIPSTLMPAVTKQGPAGRSTVQFEGTSQQNRSIELTTSNSIGQSLSGNRSENTTDTSQPRQRSTATRVDPRGRRLVVQFDRRFENGTVEGDSGPTARPVLDLGKWPFLANKLSEFRQRLQRGREGRVASS